MKTIVWKLCAALVAGGTAAPCCYGHDTPIHEEISENAALISQELNAFLRDQFGAANAPFVREPRLFFWPNENNVYSGVDGPIGWLKSGSRTEDNGIRPLRHFYDPTKVPAEGLDDLAFGMPSFTWGSQKGGANNDTWQDARDYEWAWQPIRSWVWFFSCALSL